MPRVMTALIFCSFLSVPCLAQSAAAPGAESTPQQFLEQLQSHMLQRTAGNPSFHVVANFTITEDKKAPTTLTYEETWIDPEHWRRELSDEAAHTVELRNDGKRFLEESSSSPLAISPLEAANWLLPHEAFRAGMIVEDVTVQGIALKRIGMPRADKRPALAYYQSAWLVRSAPQDLMVVIAGPRMVNYTRGGTLAGKWVPVALLVTDPDGGSISAQNIKWEANIPKSDLNTTVPAGAVEQPGTIGPIYVLASSGVVAGMRISGAAPVYPEDALRRHIQGAVEIEAIIGKDGKLRDAVVIAAPDPQLAASALQAVRTYRYRPFLVSGKPTDVMTHLHVNFVLRR